MVFQPPQSGQRPNHRGDWCPQDWQEKTDFAFMDWKASKGGVTALIIEESGDQRKETNTSI